MRASVSSKCLRADVACLALCAVIGCGDDMTFTKHQAPTRHLAPTISVAGTQHLPATVHGGGAGIPANIPLLLSVSGQSNAIGSGASPALSTTQPFSNTRLDRVTPALDPLVETTVETVASGIANQLSAIQAARVSAVDNWAVGGTEYSGLMQGTTPYDDAQDALVDAAGLQPGSRTALLWVHGEADDVNGETAAAYQGFMDDLQSDFQSDVRSNLGVSDDVPMVLSQLSNWSQYGSSSSKRRTTVGLGQWHAARDNALITLACPTYHLSYQSSGNNIHFDNQGERRLGEYFAKALYMGFLRGSVFTPLHITSAAAVSNVITVTFAGGDGSNLVADTTNMLERSNYGFEYTDGSGSPPAITGVSVSGRVVTLTLNGEAAADGVVRYGMTMAYEALLGPAGNGAGGNIRDQDPTISQSGGSNLWNWAISQELALDSYTAGSFTPPSWTNTESMITDSVQWASAPDFTTLDGATTGSWSFWVRRASAWVGAERAILAKNTSGARQFDIRGHSSGRLKIYISQNGTTNINWTSATSLISGDTWYHVAFVFDGGELLNNRLRCYVDGVDVSVLGTYSTTPPTSLSNPVNDPELSVGAGSNGSVPPGSLNLRDVSIRTSALSAAEVGDEYNSGTPIDLDSVSHGSPEHWWRLEGDFADYGSAAPAHLTGWDGVGFEAEAP